ncbi:MAG: hypothetical protein WKG01_12920 [Kofleriaceae bacterium]
MIKPRSLALGLLLASPMASAQPASVQTHLPNLLSTAPGGTADLGLDYSNFEVDLFDDVTLIAVNAHAQYLSPGGFGGYLRIPFAYASGNDESETELGNLELGGLYAIRSSAQLDILLRAAVAVDTSSDEGVLLVPYANFLPRLGDAAVTGLDTTWLRLGGQLRFSSNALRVGGGLGLDVPADGDNADGIITLAGSIGFEQGGFGAAAGLVFSQSLDDDDGGDDSLLGLNVTGDLALGPTAKLFLALGLSLEDDIEGFSIGAGVRFGF